MKLHLSIVVLFIFSQALAQEISVMEKIARELHRVINLNDKSAWIKFIKENYTEALIDKRMTAKVQTNDGDGVSNSKEE
jgi:hypothetical protein